MFHQLEQLIIFKESFEKEFLKSLFRIDARFRHQQYLSKTRILFSVYNNIYIRYRHFERFNIVSKLSKHTDRILDVGCGFGDISLELANEGRDIVLLDINPKTLLIAKRRFRKFDLKCSMVCGDAQHLPFRADSFGVTFSNQVIEHVQDPNKMMIEKMRVSKNKAIVICANPLSSQIVGLMHYKLMWGVRHIPKFVVDFGGNDETYYLNHHSLPINSKIAIIFAKILGSIPFIQKITAANVTKVYLKKE